MQGTPTTVNIYDNSSNPKVTLVFELKDPTAIRQVGPVSLSIHDFDPIDVHLYIIAGEQLTVNNKLYGS